MGWHLIPSNIEERKWQEFVITQLTEHRIAHIREEIVGIARRNNPRKYNFEKNLLNLNECVHAAWLQLINWISSKLHCTKRETYRKPMHPITNTEFQRYNE